MLNKIFPDYKIALELKHLGFREKCLTWWFDDVGLHSKFDYDNHNDNLHYVSAPTYPQVIDWFQEKHDIYIGKTGYNDNITPKRWIYHVNDIYVQDQSLDGAIEYAIGLINKRLNEYK
jgi:hypothetical protein